MINDFINTCFAFVDAGFLLGIGYQFSKPFLELFTIGINKLVDAVFTLLESKK